MLLEIRSNRYHHLEARGAARPARLRTWASHRLQARQPRPRRTGRSPAPGGGRWREEDRGPARRRRGCSVFHVAGDVPALAEAALRLGGGLYFRTAERTEGGGWMRGVAVGRNGQRAGIGGSVTRAAAAPPPTASARRFGLSAPRASRDDLSLIPRSEVQAKAWAWSPRPLAPLRAGRSARPELVLIISRQNKSHPVGLRTRWRQAWIPRPG